MSSRFLFFVLFSVLLAATVVMANNENIMLKRGAPCKCGSKSGVYWFLRLKRCPGGKGYTGNCAYFAGICCY
uniref:mRNA n=1 Tax=Oulactis sp. TaxID=2093647 RepID=A0A4D8XMZ7_OULSP|nr:mRNA [Oulactis sp. MM-2018]